MTRNLLAAGLWSGLLLAAGCGTPGKLQEGLAHQDRGEYIEAYACFRELDAAHPGDPEYRRYLNTARGLAFRQSVALSEKALQARDLEGFLFHARQAREIQPGPMIDRLVAIVEQSRAGGRPDAAILDELVRVIVGGGGGPLDGTVDAIAGLVRDGKIPAPISIVGFTFEDSPDRRRGAVGFFENDLLGRLVQKKVDVVDRAKIRLVLEEWKRGGFTDSAKAVEVGKLAGARAILTGNLAPAGNELSYQIRILDAATSGVLFSETRTFVPPKDLERLLDQP